MHIEFERSGGFMGLTTSYSFDLSELQDTDAEQLKSIIDQLKFPELPENLPGANQMPDQFTYTIYIQSEEWSHRIVTGDASAPPEIQPLIETLNTISRSHKR